MILKANYSISAAFYALKRYIIKGIMNIKKLLSFFVHSEHINTDLSK